MPYLKQNIQTYYEINPVLLPVRKIAMGVKSEVKMLRVRVYGCESNHH